VITLSETADNRNDIHTPSDNSSSNHTGNGRGDSDGHAEQQKLLRLARQLRERFFIRTDAYLRERPGKEPFCEKQEVTEVVLLRHLRGAVRIGPYTADTHNLAKLGCIDIDHTGHDKPLTPEQVKELKALGFALVHVAKQHGISLYLEISKRGGWHGWLFVAQPVPAATIGAVLRILLKECGYEIPANKKAGGPQDAIEIFPGPGEVAKDRYGLGIFMPYCNMGQGERTSFIELIAEDSYAPLSPEEFLSTVQLVEPQVLQSLVHAQKDEQQGKKTHARGQYREEPQGSCIPILTEKCEVFRNDLDIQQESGLTEGRWFSWMSTLTSAGYAHEAETVSRLSTKHDARRNRSSQRLALLKKEFAAGTIKPPHRCTTFGCDENQIRQCFKGAVKRRDGEITNSPTSHLVERNGFSGTQGRTEEPRPLRRQLQKEDPFPVEALLKLADPARSVHRIIRAPLALCCQSVLAATSLAVQGHANIHIDGRVYPLSLYCLTIALSGDRKTATDSVVSRPHREYERQIEEEYEKELRNYENDLAAFKKAREEALKKAKTREEKRKALEEVGDAPVEPRWPFLMVEEPTYEGIVKLLIHGHPSIGLFADEAARFIGGHGMNEDNRLKTAAGLSDYWDGKRTTRARGGEGATALNGRRVALHLMMQPQVAQKILSDPLLIDQGLMSRCLIAYPETLAGTREYQEEDIQQDKDLLAYSARIKIILNTPLPFANEKKNELAPRALVLNAEAKHLWIAFHNAIEKQLAPGQPFSAIHGFASKAAEHALRISGVLTLYSNITAGEISSESMRAGINLTQYYLAEALRLLHSTQIDSDILLAEKLLAWAQQRDPYLPLVDIYQRGLNQISDAATARRLVKILEDHGWFVRVPDGKTINGQFRREVWEVKK